MNVIKHLNHTICSSHCCERNKDSHRMKIISLPVNLLRGIYQMNCYPINGPPMVKMPSGSSFTMSTDLIKNGVAIQKVLKHTSR